MKNGNNKKHAYYRTFLKISFWALIIIISYMAFTPLLVPVVASVNDKLNHAVAFFVLLFIGQKAFDLSILKLIILLFIYGLLIETVQLFLPLREFSIFDILFNCLGMGLYFSIDFIYKRFKK
ncbi:VanZ family protein [Spirochaetota bacterium]